ncbi:Probable acid-CoA ligase [Mycobacteroides abscessus]|nr:Probable acid-CoA ligase [Mycobacteroides abscessus]CPU62946.1 Probable acid-CoA ligase [Mycobacteroides abscessus]SKQ30379.1 Probable acid-CoA ligase [Mycobacteroides abscessus subsp. massiliense]SKV93549.1 Probable acid-CoA ligase [Mycobacteroides abscessus subsp. massiliense]SKW99742.1 Probable acid-CoA ligase [Mycobacteroides abscessus subsp. massiliense]
MATLGGQLTLNARRHPDRPALIFEGVERSYGQLDREINQYANALLSLGVQKGDRVAVLSPNSDRFLLALYGAFKVGAIVSPFNPRSTARELAYLLEDSGASVLLFGGDTVAAVRDLAKLEQAPAAPALSLDGADGFDDFVQLASSMPDSDPQVEVREDDDCMIIYTSGTTGKPKGALFDHHRLLWVGHAVSSLGVNSFDRNLHVAPMYHCAELVLFVLSGFSMGTTHVVLPAFEPAAVLDALDRAIPDHRLPRCSHHVSDDVDGPRPRAARPLALAARLLRGGTDAADCGRETRDDLPGRRLLPAVRADRGWPHRHLLHA